MEIPKTMRAMVLEKPGTSLIEKEVPVPQPGPGQILIKVRACDLCRTDLHIVDGELTEPKLPLIPGHEIVGTVVAVGGNEGEGEGKGEGEIEGVAVLLVRRSRSWCRSPRFWPGLIQTKIPWLSSAPTG